MTGELKARKPFKVPMLFAPIYIPLLFIGAAISIPWSYVYKLRRRRDEEKFVEEMNAVGRLMTWDEFQAVTQTGRGTVIGEYLSTKGPFRVWWTPEDIPAVSPHKWNRGHHWAWPEAEFSPFFQWCHERYTNPRSGVARLVRIPEEERKGLMKKVSDVPFVSTFSSVSLRSQRREIAPKS